VLLFSLVPSTRTSNWKYFPEHADFQIDIFFKQYLL
jgi:hypothetical protein